MTPMNSADPAGRDFACVQSMDGALSIFEQESFSFTRHLPNFLLPGPLAYIGRIDSFVTSSSARMIECYKLEERGEGMGEMYDGVEGWE